MPNVWVYSIISVVIVSLLSLVGVITLGLKESVLRKLLLFLVSFAVGGLLGDTFIHLLPEASENGFTTTVAINILAGLLIFFVIEKFIHWRHCHIPTSSKHPHHLGTMNLVGDGFHNFIDGMIIGGSYLASVPVGIATTMAVILHEIPQEIGDFGILLHAGYTKSRALFFNFLSALTSVIGAIVAIIAGARILGFVDFLVPFTAGGFIYIAGSDLIPELHKESAPKRSLIQFLAILLGIAMMLVLILLE